ncbi:phosphate ABC transporter substrate-binding protein PstS [Brytella acorum]|uniref:Phosphate-binding protein PstS n=1 Tax=Brytella acorum TaxID=2959299 RepID=A0AA35VE98_9PROT|nr:phosphate ABC transporter substrate-binding protein PstS [Brytella acorum]MDF3623531.1 phosphate ABC transporter substrate-binding protein PstS [Brytella acorum]CAI9121616.1 phosphate ABC transporter substrate-binding protein PstS [Brytella acorum]
MRSIRISALASCAAVAFSAVVGLAAPAHAAGLTGAGSSFAAPLYGAWGEAIKKENGFEVNYQSVGSGAGQNQVIARTVDFGASDAPMAPAKLDANKLYQFPTVMGGIVVIINLPGIAPGQLKLDGATLAGLYDGSISSWNDPKIAALNPGVTLPDMDVAPVHRADASGTTFVFTSYLSKVSAAWKSSFGAATSVAWKGGAGARGNDGVAASVKTTEGGIGYVEYAYASRNHLNIVQLKDHDGAFIAPTLNAFAAAAKNADWAHADHYAVDLLDTAGAGAWPIVSATFVLVPTDPKSPAQAKAVREFFTWGLNKGDVAAQRLDYVVLPSSVKAQILSQWPQ